MKIGPHFARCYAHLFIGACTLASLGCGGGAFSVGPPTVVLTATKNPLVAQYSVTSGCLGQSMAEFGLDTTYGRSTAWYPATTQNFPTSFFVAGMKASTPYHMRVQFNCFGNLWTGPDQTFVTGALPTADLAPDGSPVPLTLPDITVSQSLQGLPPAPGVELFDLIRPTDTSNILDAFVTDLQGNIIWYYDPGPALTSPYPIKLMQNGHFIVNDGPLQEVDLAGNVIRNLTAAQVNQSLQANNYNFSISGFHHDVVVLPNGHWIALANTSKKFTNLPGYPGVTDVLGDVLIDVDLDGNVVWAWSTFDHLGVNRHLMGLPDWTHSNAIIYTSDGNLMVSMRNQSWILKIDYENGLGSGNVLWKLGEGGDFSLAGGDPSNWFYAQHNPGVVSEEGAQTTFAIWDNGNLRVDASGATCGVGAGPACYSRATVFQIDETAKTASLLWDYLPGFYSFWGGSIGQLSNGNIEFDLCDPFDTGASQIMEVTQSDSPQVVWQLNISGGNAYRAFRLPSLYPGIAWQQ